MKTAFDLKKNLRTLRRFARSGDAGSETAADHMTSLRGECAALLRNESFLGFTATEGFGAYFSRLRDLTEDGRTPDGETLIGRLGRDGLSAGEYLFLRDSFALLLIQTAAEAAKDGDAERLKNALLSFYTLRSLDLSAVRERCCRTNGIFGAEKAGLYSLMDDETKDEYIRRAYLSARKKRCDADVLARRLTQRAGIKNVHVGFLLFPAHPRRRAGIALICAGYALALTGAAAIGVFTGCALVPLLCFLPLTGVCCELFQNAAAQRLRSSFIPRMDPSHISPERRSVALAVSLLLSRNEDFDALERRLLTLYLSQRECGVSVVLLGDLPPSEHAREKDDAETIGRYSSLIDRLNRVEERFVLAVRGRKYSRTQRAYIGRERKRGAILALTEFMTRGENEFLLLQGASERLRGCAYLLLLDEDTHFPFGALIRAVAAAEHPLARPVVDEKNCRVVRGAAMISFPCAPSVDAARASVFARDICGFGGVPAYHGASGDFYGELFGCGVFCGKGLADVGIYETLLRDRFPAGKVLSHDIVEGCVLRVKTLTDTVLTDAFPRTQEAYLRRAHRWIRGDIQNLIFVFGKKRLKKNGKTDVLSAYQLLDNVRRALFPAAVLFGVLVSPFLPEGAGIAAASVCLFCACFSYLRSALAALVAGGFRTLTGSFRGRAAGRAFSALREGALAVCRIGVEGLNAADAVFRALYRMAVSKRNLLEWTTAASAQTGSEKRRILLRRIPVLPGAAWLFLTGRPLFALIGVSFVFDLIYALCSGGRPKEKKIRLSADEKTYLLEQTKKIWNFFADSHREKYNYLPPDNLCLSPVPSVAARTSPTNIGLCLCAFLAARDLGYIDSGRLYTMLDQTLSAAEKLETSRGNLLNWYDIVTLEPLSPAFVSYVDSGNFLCCLIALKEGLREYFSEEPRLFDLTARIEKLIEGCDLSVFYDPVRHLFRTGYDAHTGKNADSYYDLRISEARMSGFAAVALGQVPVRHLGAPARVGGRYRGAEGLLSWSGTMFEYFMPRLFLPVRRNTLDDASLWFAYLAQRGFGRKQGVPWGVSESCYFAFDGNMNYCYKANGVGVCALNRSAERETVIAPYATFLTLPFVGSPAAENLKRLEKAGAVGKYGFYEAMDFTPGRCGENSPAAVRVFMSHHLGMSLLAAQNALQGDPWPRRFTSRREILAASELLDEGVAPGLRVPARERAAKQPKEKQRRSGAGGCPAVLFSGGEMAAAVHSNGCAALVFGGRSLFFPGENVYREPFGVFAALFSDGRAIPFTPAPLYVDRAYGFSLHGNAAVWRVSGDGLSLRQRFSLQKNIPAAIYRYRVKNKTGKRLALSFCVYAEPSLAFPRGERAHRAYSKLFIKSRIDGKRGAMIFERHSAGGTCCVVMGLDAACIYTADKNRAFDDVPMDRLPAPDGVAGSVDCCFSARTQIRLGARSQTELTLTVCAGETAAEALERFDALAADRAQTAEPVFRNAPSRAALLSAILCDLIFRIDTSRRSGDSPCQRDLWPSGISGDRPVIAADAARNPRSTLADISAVSRILNACGFENELALICEETDAYDAPLKKAAEDILRGVPLARVVDAARLPKTAEAVFSVSRASFPPVGECGGKEISELRRCSADLSRGMRSGDTDGGFLIVRAAGQTPWSWCLSNRSFGTLFTNRSLGYTWALNSAENKLTPWFGAPDAPQRGELMTLTADGAVYDLIDGAAAVFCEKRASWYARVGSLYIETELTVPEAGMKKSLRVRILNRGKGRFRGELSYTVFPVLGRETLHGEYVRSGEFRKGVLFRNHWTGQNDGYMYLYSPQASPAPPAAFRCCAGLAGGGCARVPLSIEAGASAEAVFFITFALDRNAAAFLARTPFLPQMRITVLPRSLKDRAPTAFCEKYILWQIRRVRLYARCGPYQCSGAYGFRDQLQDSMNLALADPEPLKIQLFRSAAAQFSEGDVLHWFHIGIENGKQTIKGVRTHCSDDLLWLPLAVAEYARVTGDTEILKKEIPFLVHFPLGDNERDRYAVCGRTAGRRPLSEHCLLALERADRVGSHGLLLMGGGDWNDSFGEAGDRGRGESVWLTQFWALTAKRFAPLCDRETKEKMLRRAGELLAAIDREAWFGDRYARAFYDDGTPMGVAGSGNSEIDLLPQSFAALSGMQNADRVRTALKTAYELLYDKKNNIVKLFDPPFDESKKHTGYVNFYPRGVRENGGQYTHAAVWFALALHRAGCGTEARRIMDALDPMRHLGPDGDTGTYRNEPYALSADVYSLQNYEGRGGWSMYTGAAGWYFRAAAEIYGENREKND